VPLPAHRRERLPLTARRFVLGLFVGRFCLFVARKMVPPFHLAIINHPFFRMYFEQQMRRQKVW
jgi:hypothetical protein